MRICTVKQTRLLVAATCMAATASVLGATWHVSPSAGGQGNGSPAAPFSTVAAAVEAAGAGDTIIVRQGHYLQTQPITISKPGIKLMGISGERALLVADEQASAVLIIVADNVVVQDLVLQGGNYGLKIDVQDEAATHGVAIRNCSIGSTSADCIKSFNADALTIENCQIGPSGLRQKDNAEGIDVNGSKGVTVRNCMIRDVATNGIYFKGGTRDGVIERCFIANTGHSGLLLGQDTDLEFMRDHVVNEAIHCTARNNIIVNASAAGMGTYSGRQITFVNNTLIDVAGTMQAGVWIVTNGRHVPAEEVTIRNNIIVVGSDRPAMFLLDTALPDSDFNVFFARKGAVRFVREMNEEASLNRQWTLEQWKESAGKDVHSRLGDPKLEKVYFRPLQGSPAIGAADTKGPVPDDYFGRRRGEASADAGAVIASWREEKAQAPREATP